MTDKRSSAASLLYSVFLFAIAAISQSASAMDPHQLLQLCKASQQRSDSKSGTVVVRAFPRNARAATIPIDGESLLNVILEPAVASLAKELSEKYFQNTIGDSNIERNLRSPFFFADDLSEADGVMIGRGNQLFVFPRFMLLHPIAQYLTIRPGDVVATFDSRISDKTESEDRRDAIRKFVVESDAPLDSSVDFASTEELSAEGVELFRLAQKNNELKSLSTLIDVDGTIHNPLGTSIEELLVQQSSAAAVSQLVFVLSRRKDQLVINYVIPFRSSGPLGNEGILFNLLFKDIAEKNGSEWLRALGGFYELQFRKADKLIVTRLEKMPFFVLGR